MHMYKKRILKDAIELHLINFFVIFQSWSDVSFLLLLTKVVWWVSRLLIEVSWILKWGLNLPEQMLSEWCTVLLRNLSTVLQSSRSGTLLCLLPCLSSPSCIPHSPSEKSRFSCQDIMLSFGLMRVTLESLNLLNSHEPTNWFVKYCPLLLVCFHGCLVLFFSDV